jgi:D-beta-D-heptose 7-phosphate kinase/D-beta-D-heptose 1-phosphate adenosyltransferase
MKIVFTNGCFDILHIGHVRLLKQARNLGDYLIVGLNSDKSVTQLKGENRPIFNHYHRKEILESLRYVDEVIIFHEPTPLELIKMIKPDILVKGPDYQDKEIVGADLVSQVIILARDYDISTTQITNRI